MRPLVGVRLPADGEPYVTDPHDDAGRETAPPEGPGLRSPAVAVAFVVLVLLSWAALIVAPGPERDTGDRPFRQVQLPEILPGFRPDLAYLPDEALLGFVEIPGGAFLMGSDPGDDTLSFNVEWWGNGRVQGTPDVPTFYMARYEVTVAQYAAFLNASGHPVLDPQVVQAPPDHPAAWVAWTDAVAYVLWLDDLLRQREDLPPDIAALLDAGWRVVLPDEAQWEKAARGSDGRLYPWGNGPEPGFANYRARGTAPVGSFDCPPCAHGLADMSGNVWEWTRSPYQPYPFTPDDDLETLRTEALWVMRGGSFGDPEQMIRAANRGGADPGARRAFIGFRVALVPPED